MASASFNDLLNNAEDDGFTLFPEGTYDVVVEEASGEPAKSGRDQVVATFKVLNGPKAGSTFRHFMVVVPEYPGLVGRWFAEMAHLGLSREYFKAEPTYKQVAGAIVGSRVRVVVGRRLNKKTNEDTEDIKVIGALAGGVPKVPGMPGGLPAPVAAAPAAPAPVPAAHAADPSAPNLPPF